MQHYGDGIYNSRNNFRYFNRIRQSGKKDADCIYTISAAGIRIDGGIYVTENKLNIDLSYGLKGSYTVEEQLLYLYLLLCLR